MLASPAARFEIEPGDRHFAAFEQVGQVAVEQVQVQGVQGFEIAFAARVQGTGFAVDEIVVHGQGQRPDAVDLQLGGQALGKGGLAGSRRTGHQHQAQFLFFGGDGVGDAGDLFFVQALGHLDDLGNAAPGDDLVQAAHVADAEDLSPVLAFLVDLEELARLADVAVDLEVLLLGKEDDEARAVRFQLEARHGAGGVGQRVDLEVGEAAVLIDLDLVDAGIFDQALAVAHAALGKIEDGLGAGQQQALERQVVVDDLPHFRGDAR